MQFVKIGKRTINLAQILYIEWDTPFKNDVLDELVFIHYIRFVESCRDIQFMADSPEGKQLEEYFADFRNFVTSEGVPI